MTTPLNIMQAIADDQLLGSAFRDKATWRRWFAFLRCLFGLKLSKDELATFHECTARTAPRAGGYVEAWLICGRRAGKSLMLALIAVFLACFRDYRPFLSAGERGVIMVIATDRRQAQVILGYVRGMLSSPMLSQEVIGETAEAIELSGNVDIQVQTASFRGLRGRTVIAALCDEIAFWRSEESANPDAEILNALRPAMATIPGAMLLCASSPYARKGVLFKAFDRHFGKDDSAPLVWKAPSLTMNPALDPAIVEAAMAEDEAAARAEWCAEFRSDVEQFVKLETVRACVGGYTTRGFDSGLHYFGFCDPSGGSSDEFTMALAHREREQVCIVRYLARSPPSRRTLLLTSSPASCAAIASARCTETGSGANSRASCSGGTASSTASPARTGASCIKACCRCSIPAGSNCRTMKS